MSPFCGARCLLVVVVDTGRRREGHGAAGGWSRVRVLAVATAPVRAWLLWLWGRGGWDGRKRVGRASRRVRGVRGAEGLDTRRRRAGQGGQGEARTLWGRGAPRCSIQSMYRSPWAHGTKNKAYNPKQVRPYSAVFISSSWTVVFKQRSRVQEGNQILGRGQPSGLLAHLEQR
jgi:hypothetical protein